jgi:carbon-monoxide dehydrogenase large subunit
MRFVGAQVERTEDRRILTGRGHYVDDVQLPAMAHGAFLRSPHAHARITATDVNEALGAPGVVAVVTGEDIQTMTSPIRLASIAPNLKLPEFYALATDRVRFVGDPVALVVADTRARAEDATELISAPTSRFLRW